jgi:hypothetical protein
MPEPQQATIQHGIPVAEAERRAGPVPVGDAAAAHSIVVMKGSNVNGPFDNRLY